MYTKFNKHNYPVLEKGEVVELDSYVRGEKIELRRERERSLLPWEKATT